MRQSLTPAEVRLWARLKGQACEGFKFRRQHPIGPFFADFACTEAHLVVEIDGQIHQSIDAQTYDHERTEYLEMAGWRVIRFTNEAVLHDTYKVVSLIAEAAHALVFKQFAPSAPSGHLPHFGKAETGEENVKR
jgi:very-short-patch-repair endonuclease